MAATVYLEFEKSIAELEKKIEELRALNGGSELNLTDDISSLEKRVEQERQEIFNNLSRWQKAQVARHINRPFTLDYIKHLFTDFNELHGDRNYGDDHAIVGGLARFDGQPVMVVGHQKG
ncbi:MAG: acetyl-CoA carboxylase carboxyl transferase subunit alpha, partial [Geobacter sp.]